MKKTVGGLRVLLEGDHKKQPIIFVHGFPYDHTMWQAQIEALSENFYCVAYDVKGLGNSCVGDGQFTMESFVDDLEMLMHELCLENPILCGFSMGGYICLRAVERMEEKFSALILCDTTSKADSNEGKLKRADVISRINALGLTTFTQSFVTQCYGEWYQKEHKDEIKKRIAKSTAFNSIGVKGCIFAMLSRTDTTEYLNKITLPTLILCGDHDTITPPTMMKEMAEQIKGARFVLIKHSGHMSVIENSAEANNAIKEFLLDKKVR